MLSKPGSWWSSSSRMHTAGGHNHQKGKAIFIPSKVRGVALRGNSHSGAAYFGKEKRTPINFPEKMPLKTGRILWLKRGESRENLIYWVTLKLSLISLSIWGRIQQHWFAKAKSKKDPRASILYRHIFHLKEENRSFHSPIWFIVMP